MLFLGILLVIGIIIFNKLHFFIGSFLGATTLYVVSRNALFMLTDRFRWRRWVAALTIVLAAAVILGGLGYMVFEEVARQIPAVDTSKIVTKLGALSDQVNGTLGFKALSKDVLGEYSSVLKKGVSAVLNTAYSFAANLFMMLVILFFMLANARRMECRILTYQPFRGESLSMVKREVRNMVYGNAVGIPLIMLAQGIVAWVIYLIYGFDNAVFWAFLTAFSGLIPMVGTALVTAPLGIYLVSNGHLFGGVLLIALGLFVIANVDNLVRIVLMKKMADTHPLVVIFGVVLGIPLFGFWGIIFGPLLISGFLLLIKIYYHEYSLIPESETGADGEIRCDSGAAGSDGDTGSKG